MNRIALWEEAVNNLDSSSSAEDIRNTIISGILLIADIQLACEQLTNILED